MYSQLDSRTWRHKSKRIMIMRRYLSATAKRWIFWLSVSVVVIFGSVAYVQFNRNHRNGLWNQIQYDGRKLLQGMRNEVEEARLSDDVHQNIIPATNSELSTESTDLEQQTLLVKKPKTLRKDCPASPTNEVKPTYDVSEMHYSLKGTDLNWDGDAGVWDQKMQAQYEKEFNSPEQRNRTLKVFLVPFSHSDPGWTSTVDEYFTTYTQRTLDLMLERLKLWKDMTFIWAEISFFKMWWDNLNATQQHDVQQLVKEGRLEIVNGGYVMPDEATCHYYAIIHQYIYGHQWIKQHLNTTPRHGFSIDPFGYSSTMPYLLKNLGFDSMFIQRIHYIIRKRMLHEGASQFLWQQPWDSKNTDAMFCYMSHATLYDVKHTCGVNPEVCVQFDYQYHALQDNMTIPDRSKAFLDQIRKTAFMYPHDVLLIPLGMDFRWSNTFEWDSKYGNFHQMMDFLNKDPSFNVQINFGTYQNYYDEVFRQMGKPKEWKDLPSIVGDFFPYADKFQEYWTGYFTSHPYQKLLSRLLERQLRTAELLYSLAMVRKIKLDNDVLLQYLDTASRHLGLFQHHDAITGTSKQYVSDDYEKRLHKGLKLANAVISYMASVFYWPSDDQHEPFDVNTVILSEKELPSKKLIHVKDRGPKTVVIFSSLASARKVVVDLFVDREFVVIEDLGGKVVPYQTGMVLDNGVNGQAFGNGYRITFFAEAKSIGFVTFKIRDADQATADKNGRHVPKLYDKPSKSLDQSKMIILKNRYFTAELSPSSGLLQSITGTDGERRKVQLEFKRYETQKSGAYLFVPSGIADWVPYPHDVRFVDGELYSEVNVILPGLVCHTVRMYKTDGDLGKFLDMDNTHNIMNEFNVEAVMRFSTDIVNNMTFYTDSNGFQMVRRRASHDLQMQANYFPATNMAFLQDETARFTIHMDKAQGVGSQDTGQLEVMIDRALGQDDARGVEEALKDQHTARTTMRIQLEADGFCRKCERNDPTSLASRVNLDLNHPATVLAANTSENETSSAKELLVMTEALPCDTHLVLMKPVTFGKAETKCGVIFHKLGVDCDNLGEKDHSCWHHDKVDLGKFLRQDGLGPHSLTGLNFIENQKSVQSSSEIQLERKKLVAVALDTAPVNRKDNKAL